MGNHRFVDILKAEHWVNVDGVCVCRVRADTVQVDNYLERAHDET